MSLQDWLSSGWLTEHRTSRQEIAELLAVADRDLRDCQIPGLSSDWRLNIAYNAALQAANAALAAAGYRAAREAHHFRVIQSLAYTVKVDESLTAQFDLFRKKRNISGYERVGATSDHEANEMLALAQNLRKDVQQWLRRNKTELLGE